MSAKRQVVVRIDGKIADSNFSREKITNRKEKLLKDEIAAAEETGENEIHTFAREYDPSLAITKATSKSQSKFDMFKPIIIAIISAAVIGSIMGFIMLKIIVNFDNDINGTPAVQVPSGNEEKSNGASTKKGTYALEAMSAFVLQGGVFSSVENAEAESAKFLENGYTPVIWEKDSQFYLLVHLGMTKEELQDDTTSLMNNGIEAYAKEWQLMEKEVEVTEAEYAWLTSFQENWNVSLGEGKIDNSKWTKLIEQVPADSALLSNLVSLLTDQLEALETKDHKQILLAMLESYDSTIK